jgi:outer membrane protein
MKRIVLALVLVAVAASYGRTEQLTLAECLERAARQNPALKVAAFDPKIAAETVRLAKSGARPRVDLQGGYVAQLEPQSVKFGPLTEATQQADFAFLGLSIYQTIYDFGRTAEREQQAVLQEQALTNRYQSSEQDTFLQVVRAYYGLLQAQKLLAVAADEVRQREQHLTVAEALYEQGVTTRNDLLQAEVKLAGSRQRRLAAGNAVENGWLRLNYLTGTPPATRGELAESSPRPAVATTATPADALAGRQELRAQQAIVRATEAAVKESKTAFYPELFAKLALDYVQNDRVTEQAIMAATIGLKINLYDGLASTSRQRQAVAALGQERERLRGLEAAVGLELQTAQNDAAVAAQQIGVAEQAIRQGEENLRINTDRYQAQVGTATEVIDAQTLLSQIKSDYHQATFDHQVALARLKRALGEL